MDFVHEDLSLMSREMERWRALHTVKVSQFPVVIFVGFSLVRKRVKTRMFFVHGVNFPNAIYVHFFLSQDVLRRGMVHKKGTTSRYLSTEKTLHIYLCGW